MTPMRPDARNIESGGLEAALEFVRREAERGTTRIWIERPTRDGWHLAYGGDPEGAAHYLQNVWCGQRIRLGVPDDDMI